MLLRQSAGSLARANAELEAKSGRTGRTSLAARLASNFRDKGTRLSKVAQGEDDQMQRLHEARFLPGPLCNLADVWRRAREVLPEKGLLPYAHYDVASLGLGNQISSKGWTVLHDPGSLDLTLKLFGKGIMALGSANSEMNEGPDNLDAFKLALSAARTGQQLVTPWNLSITAIQAFLENMNFGYKYFRSQKEHVARLVDFVNDCFVTNAKNWQLDKPFMTSADLSVQWTVFTSGLTANQEKTTFPARAFKRQRSPSPGKGGKAPRPSGGGPCRRYNEGRCPNSHRSCTFRGLQLAHTCSFVDRNGKMCGKLHAAKDHR
jgi:hypothetical protein